MAPDPMHVDVDVVPQKYNSSGSGLFATFRKLGLSNQAQPKFSVDGSAVVSQADLRDRQAHAAQGLKNLRRLIKAVVRKKILCHSINWPGLLSAIYEAAEAAGIETIRLVGHGTSACTTDSSWLR
jgi:hypothetical protein